MNNVIIRFHFITSVPPLDLNHKSVKSIHDSVYLVILDIVFVSHTTSHSEVYHGLMKV